FARDPTTEPAELLRGRRRRPPAPRRHPPRRREVMERDHRIDTRGEQRLAQGAVTRDRCGGPLPFLRFDAAPLDREAVVVEPELTTQRDVVRPAVPRVAAVTARFLAT